MNNSFDAVLDLPEKWIDITVTAKESKVEISVTDSGSGIPEQVAKKLMQPFFTTKEIGKGSGLGLSTSAGILKSHQGTIAYDPNSKNTRFVIQLPMAHSNTQGTHAA